MRIRIAAIIAIILLLTGGAFYLAHQAEISAPPQEDIRIEVPHGAN